MIDFLSDDFVQIEKYFIDSIDEVELVDIIKIDKNNINKMDMLILSKYGYRNKEYVKRFLPLILSFNNLADITEITIGTIVKFPDLNSLVSNLEIDNTFITDVVSGINKVGYVKSSLLSNNLNSNISTALPKLNITLPKVTYEPESGIITY